MGITPSLAILAFAGQNLPIKDLPESYQNKEGCILQLIFTDKTYSFYRKYKRFFFPNDFVLIKLYRIKMYIIFFLILEKCTDGTVRLVESLSTPGVSNEDYLPLNRLWSLLISFHLSHCRKTCYYS